MITETPRLQSAVFFFSLKALQTPCSVQNDRSAEEHQVLEQSNATARHQLRFTPICMGLMVPSGPLLHPLPGSSPRAWG